MAVLVQLKLLVDSIWDTCYLAVAFSRIYFTITSLLYIHCILQELL